jgi:hypothetical protein
MAAFFACINVNKFVTPVLYTLSPSNYHDITTGSNGGYTAKVANACVIIPTVNSATVTPHSEAFQAVVWHLLVSHPKLKASQTKWESAVF